MYIPTEIKKQVAENETRSILQKYESLDYRQFENYEKLCAEYRQAVDDKNSQLADSLNTLMYRVQKSRPRKNIQAIVNNTESKKRSKRLERKPKQKSISKKQKIIGYTPKEIPRVFSFENALSFFNLHRKTSRSFRSSEFAMYFDIDLIDAENILDLAVKMTILKVTTGHKYYRAKMGKIDLDKYEKFAGISKGEVRALLAELIDKTGPIEYISTHAPNRNITFNTPRKKSNSHADKRSKTKHYKSPSGISYSLEIKGNSVGSDRVSGGGRKKSMERTDKDALNDYRTRYGLNESSILDYDLD